VSEDKKEGGGWIVAALVLLACYTTLPEGLVYHGGRLLKRPVVASRGLLEAEVERAADAYGLSRKVLKALVRVESAYNPKAVSRVGARGIAQIMPFNAKRCGLPNADHLWDPTYNLRCGARILREELDQHGDLQRALTVYNCGRVKCAEGQQYAKKVLALSTVY
jgi:soluble lytic murein transglycosylase-like protein